MPESAQRRRIGPASAGRRREICTVSQARRDSKRTELNTRDGVAEHPGRRDRCSETSCWRCERAMDRSQRCPRRRRLRRACRVSAAMRGPVRSVVENESTRRPHASRRMSFAARRGATARAAQWTLSMVCRAAFRAGAVQVGRAHARLEHVTGRPRRRTRSATTLPLRRSACPRLRPSRARPPGPSSPLRSAAAVRAAKGPRHSSLAPLRPA